ncbi:MAG: substrate-binding domain-containing protein [Verrucomicrobia bacterium]|nr:substrate-binding domain-containing protein [Verrucomicrobiota bacterium]MCH8512012.1 substrate-binding domain-containing protein [Kiritimatiellia bacterium]
MPALKRIALVMGHFPYNHNIRVGLRKYTLPDKPWILEWFGPGLDAVERLKHEGADGVITHIQSAEMGHALRELDLPVVNVGSQYPGVFPDQLVDHSGVGRMAAAYFADRGFRRVAFIGHPNMRYSNLRMEAFMEVASQRGLDMTLGEIPAPLSSGEGWETPGKVMDLLEDWLDSIPSPVAVFCCNDNLARTLMDVCRVAGRRIPREVAILGVDNDDPHGLLSSVALSSVDIGAERIGFAAGKVLETLMKTRGKGKSAPAESLSQFHPPLGVVTRASTEVAHVRDPRLAAALEYLRQNAGKPVNIGDLPKIAGVSRRGLEGLFKEETGYTPLQYLHRLRVDTAKKVLLETDFPMSWVAERCGFKDAEQLSRLFHKHAGIPPSEFRRASRV